MRELAVISPCERYRYLLKRPCDDMLAPRAAAVFVMLNPSTADAQVDDPTIRRCRGFAKTWGCRGLVVANLYALRSTDPGALRGVQDPIGPENDRHLQELAREYGDIVCAWGSHAEPPRVEHVSRILRLAGARLWCLGTNKDGAPRHPLYVPADQRLARWDGAIPHA